MMVLHPELQANSGGSDVTKCLTALNVAQYHFEMLLALEPDLLGDFTGTVTTTGLTESTTFPAGVLRIDRLQFIEPSTGRPAWDLEDIKRTGGHIMTPGWPYNVLNFVTATGGGGKPVAYYTNGTNIYWVPQPDTAYNIRWYGFQKAADVTVGYTFPYQDACLLPMATFAVKIIRIGLDDPVENYTELAKEVFEPTLKALGNFKREKAPGMNYRWIHVS